MDKDLQTFKYEISQAVLKYKAAQQDMSVSDYGSVYDPERHEDLLNMLTRIVWASDDEGVIKIVKDRRRG